MARDIPARVSPYTPNTINVVLGGVEYDIAPLPVSAERAWKQAADAHLDGLLALLEGMPNQELATTQDLMPVLRAMKHTLMFATDTILELVCAYAPNVAADRERIEAEAFTPEIIALFVEIVPVVFPLAQLAPALRGLAPLLTSRKSAAPNGTLPKAT